MTSSEDSGISSSNGDESLQQQVSKNILIHNIHNPINPSASAQHPMALANQAINQDALCRLNNSFSPQMLRPSSVATETSNSSESEMSEGLSSPTLSTAMVNKTGGAERKVKINLTPCIFRI